MSLRSQGALAAVAALGRNPLSQWGLVHARRDKKFFATVVVFMLVFYGLAMLFVLAWAQTFSKDLKDLLNSFYGLALTINTLVLLYWAPSRVASTIAKQREEGLLDMLRMTGMSGRELAMGHLLTQLSLPLILSASTLPLVLFSMGSEMGFGGVVRVYTCLALLTPIYAMIGALVGLSLKKAQHAGTTAVFVSMGLMGLAGAALGPNQADFKIFALLSFWGPMMAQMDANSPFTMLVFGEPIAGDFLQIAFLVILNRALLSGLAQRYDGEASLFFGRHGGLSVVFALCLLSCMTFYPTPQLADMIRFDNPSLAHEAALAFHTIVPFVALLWFALEAPLEARGLRRGFARRDADDAVPIDEHLGSSRFLPPIVVYLAMSVVMGISIVLASQGGLIQVTLANLCLGSFIAISAFMVAALTVQLATLFMRDRNMPRMIAVIGLLVLWMGPIVASVILEMTGFGKSVSELPAVINPFVGMYAASLTSPNPGGFEPTALALCSAAVQIFLVIGLVSVLKVQVERLREHANSLVVLPADAYAAPGTLTQKCEQGHLYTDAWAECPHCEPSAQRVVVEDTGVASAGSADATSEGRTRATPQVAVGAPATSLEGETRANPFAPSDAPPGAAPSGPQAPGVQQDRPSQGSDRLDLRTQDTIARVIERKMERGLLPRSAAEESLELDSPEASEPGPASGLDPDPQAPPAQAPPSGPDSL